MAQFVLINAIGTRRAGEVLDSVQDGQAVITQLAAFGGVLVPLPNATLQPYIKAAQLAYDRADSTQAQNIMLAGYASTTAIAGGGTAGTIPIWTAGSVLGDSVLQQAGALVGVNVAPTASLSLPGGLLGAASMNFATGVAPAAPNSGDLWFDGTYLYLRASGVDQPLNAPFGTGTPNVLTKWSSVSGLTDTAITEASGAIATLTLTNAGAGATNGTYSQVALTGGAGSGATADIVVAGNVVTRLVLRSPGTGYVAGNTLSTAAIGGAGFVFTVSAVSASDNASGNVTALRLGAGSANPRYAVDALGALVSSKSESVFYSYWGNGVAANQVAQTGLLVDTRNEVGGAIPISLSGATAGAIVSLNVDCSAATASAFPNGIESRLALTRFAAAGSTSPYGVLSDVRAASILDSGKTVNLIGVGSFVSVNSLVLSNTYNPLRAYASSVQVFSSNVQTISTLYHYDATTTALSGAAHVVTTGYGLRIRAMSLAGGSTVATWYGVRLDAQPTTGITTQWGVSQESTTAKNQFLGNLGVGVDPAAGKVIASLTLTNGGTGYTNGTYVEVALTTSTGSGSGATADIVVAGGIVTTVLLRSPGQGYAVGDTLSCASIGAGSNFLLTVATTASILRSDGTSVATRVGAGTTTPRASFDAANGVMISGTGLMIEQSWSGSFVNTNIAAYIGGSVTPNTIYRGLIVDTLVNTTSMAAQVTSGLYAGLKNTNSAAGTTTNLTGVTSALYRSYANDLSTTANVTGFSAVLGTRSGVGSVTSGAYTFYTGNLFHTVSGHTFTSLTWYDAQPVTLTGNVTTSYLLRGRAFAGAGTITNRWAISQEDPFAKSAHYGNFGVGNALDVGAGKVIASLTLTNAGAGATNGTYSQVALTGGSGTGATADIVVAGNVVTVLTLRNPGQGYVVGNTLSTAAIGGAGFVFTVATTASILRSDGTVVAPRVGAGTSTPRAAVDVASGAYIGTSTDQFAALLGPTSTPFLIRGGIIWQGAVDSTAANETLNGLHVYTTHNVTAATATATVGAARFGARVANSTAGQTVSNTTVNITGQRIEPNDLATNSTLIALQANASIGSTLGAASTNQLWGLNVLTSNLLAGHTVTTGYTARFQASATGNFTTLERISVPATSGTGTITTFYGLRLEASTTPTITNRWAISIEDPLSKSRHYGNFGVGNALDVGAGKIIASLTLTAGGTLYTNGTYAQVALTGGTGTGATADIVISGNAVTTVALRNPGQGYVVGDVLSVAAASVGGTGSGFQATVATTASILRSDGSVVAPRVGAGTTSPVAGVHAASTAVLGDGTPDRIVASLFSGSTTTLRASFLSLANVTTPDTSLSGAAVLPRADIAAGSANAVYGVYAVPQVTGSAAAQANTVAGVWGLAYRSHANDLSTASTIYGGAFFAGTIGSPGAASTSAMYAVAGTVNNSVAAHTIVNGQAIRAVVAATGPITTAASVNAVPVVGAGTVATYYGLRIEASPAATITNRYNFTQEDTLGANYVRAKTFFGPAVGTAAATTASVEITAQGTLNGDLRLNSASAVVDVSAASSNGVKFNNRGGAGITSTTQLNYEEGTYTPTLSAGWTVTAGNYSGTWTRNGRLVTLTIQFFGGTNSGATGGSTISTPVGLTPVRNGAGTAVNANGTALGNGVVVVTTAGTIINANAITTTTVDKTIVVQYEV